MFFLKPKIGFICFLEYSYKAKNWKVKNMFISVLNHYIHCIIIKETLLSLEMEQWRKKNKTVSDVTERLDFTNAQSQRQQ